MRAVLAAALVCFLAAGSASSSDDVPFHPVDAAGRTAPIVLGASPTPGERTAARELAEYLTRITGAAFEVYDEGRYRPVGPAIWVGDTAVARAHGVASERLGSETWRLLQTDVGLIVGGGRPRGTLYAAYRLLEDELGVRWWTPFDEHVPDDPHPAIGVLDATGRPAFALRDLNALAGPPAFRARRRLNGHHSELGPEFGGSERYGPPYHVHTFAWYVPAAELGASRPELFALIDGARRPGEGQLCTSAPAVRELLLDRIRDSVDQGRAAAEAAGLEPPTVFELSADDRDGYCECAPCRRLVEAHGGQSGPMLDLVSELADELAADRPGVRLSTLAYHATVRPPVDLVPSPHVVVRFSDLQSRDFLRPLADRRHAAPLSWLDRWLELATEVRVWTYGVSFGSGRGLPFPNLAPLAADLRLYAERDVRGVYVQFDHPELSDHRALKRWVLSRLLEEPGLELDALVREFTDGYFGEAGRAIRRARRIVERAALSAPTGIRYPARRSQFGFLDADTIRRVQRQYDRAERAVRDDAVRLERVRRARMSIDRATLAFAATLGGDRRSWSWSGPELDPIAVAERLRSTWSARIEQRVPVADRARARAEMTGELEPWLGTAGR